MDGATAARAGLMPAQQVIRPARHAEQQVKAGRTPGARIGIDQGYDLIAD